MLLRTRGLQRQNRLIKFLHLAASLAADNKKGAAMSFGLYSIGFAIVIGGLIYAAYLMHMPAHWIAVGAVVLLGVGILSGVKATRQKDAA
jgi:hypothetical protein